MNNRLRGFTLIELLLSITILVILVALLGTILGQASRLFSRGEALNEAQGNFRAASALLSRDLSAALLPVERTNQASLQFILNPPGLSGEYKNRDALFWQCATECQADSTGVSIVGYFVSWDTSNPNRPQASLCRMAINANDASYRIYKNPDAWINDDVVKAAAPAAKASNYRGLLANNVVALWITLEERSGGTLTPLTSFDSRVTKTLPAAAQFSFAFISPSAAARLTAADATAIRNLCQTASATNFIAGMPASLRPDTQIYTTRIALP